MIEVQGLSHYYRPASGREREFLHRRQRGHRLPGLNGAGKSTTLKVLADPESDQGRRSDRWRRRPAPMSFRAQIGYLPDSTAMAVEFCARRRHQRHVEGRSRRPPIVLRRANLRHGAAGDRRASHGFKKRVAQAIIHKPKLVILDEPISGLDPMQIIEMRQVVRDLRLESTVLVSSHILSEISQTCDRILVLLQGRLVARGTEAELRQKTGTGTNIVAELRPLEKVKAAPRRDPTVVSHQIAAAHTVRRTKEDRREDLRRPVQADIMRASVRGRARRARGDLPVSRRERGSA